MSYFNDSTINLKIYIKLKLIILLSPPLPKRILTQIDHSFNTISPSICCLGKADYDVLYPNSSAWDLNQDPRHRPRKCGSVLATLTTGCSHWFVRECKRCMAGLELMALHSIPVSDGLARIMSCAKVDTTSVSNTGCCFLAGNSMHCASIGTVLALGLLCTKPRV